MTHDNQKYIALQERDGSDVYYHGTLRVPDGKGYDDVKRVFVKVTNEHPDDWTYDDILSALHEYA